MFIGKGVLKICIKFTDEHPCQNAISIKLLCNCIEIKLRHGCSPVNLLLIFRTPFPKNPSGWLLPFILRKRLLNSFILFCNTLKMLYLNPANMDLFKVNNRNSTKGVKYVQS